MSTAFLEFHNFNPPAVGDTLAPVQYGYQSTEFTGTLVEATGVAQPAVLGDGYIGFYGGYYPTTDNVASGVAFGSPVMTGTLGAAPVTTSPSTGNLIMGKTGIRVDEDVVFGVNIKQNGQFTDVQGGAASLSGLSLILIRDGDTTELDPAAGVTFTKVGTVDGVYEAVYDRTAMLDAGGAAYVPAVGDDLKFIPQAEVVAGSPPLPGVEDSVCIIAVDSASDPLAEWSVC